MAATPVGKAVEDVLAVVTRAEAILASGPPSEDALVDEIDALVKALPRLREAAKETTAKDDVSATFPIGVLQHVDEGKDPVRFVVDGLLAVGEANDACKGKVNVFDAFHRALEEEMSKPRTPPGGEDASVKEEEPAPSPKRAKRSPKKK